MSVSLNYKASYSVFDTFSFYSANLINTDSDLVPSVSWNVVRNFIDYTINYVNSVLHFCTKLCGKLCLERI